MADMAPPTTSRTPDILSVFDLRPHPVEEPLIFLRLHLRVSDGYIAKNCVTYGAGNQQQQENQKNKTIARTGIQNCGLIEPSMKMDWQSDGLGDKGPSMDHPSSSGQAQRKCFRRHSYKHRLEPCFRYDLRRVIRGNYRSAVPVLEWSA